MKVKKLHRFGVAVALAPAVGAGAGALAFAHGGDHACVSSQGVQRRRGRWSA